MIATGQLERGHSYKDALAKDASPNAGVFNYPVLMAADILLFDAHRVPVGKDQKQHLEVCRDVAGRFNHVYGDTLIIPEAHISDAPLVPGTDGDKMSKSRGNSIPLFAPSKKLRKVVMGIKTGSETLEEPKDVRTKRASTRSSKLAKRALARWLRPRWPACAPPSEFASWPRRRGRCRSCASLSP